MRPLAIDLYCGLGGWSEGFLAEGYACVGFDNQRHRYTSLTQHRASATEIITHKYPGQLVLQDVLTLRGSQFRDAAVIVASPPCQNYSYLAMPWSRSKDPNNSKSAKALRLKWETEGPDNRLFDACFRIQLEACEAAGHFIPLIVENVRGAQPWVGRSAWNYGSFHLWGDVPALMPINLTRRMKSRIECAPRRFSDRMASTPEEAHALHYSLPDGQKANPDGSNHPRGSWFAIADSSQRDRREGQKVPEYSDPRRNGGKGVHLTSPAENAEGTKIGGDWFSKAACDAGSNSRFSSKSNARKMASAQIAKIPFDLARHIAAVYYPR